MNTIIKNWKTTLGGIIVAGVTIALAMHKITPDVAAAISGLAITLGLIAAKDGDKTGV